MTTLAVVLSTCGQLGVSYSVLYYVKRRPAGVVLLESLQLSAALCLITAFGTVVLGVLIGARLFNLGTLAGLSIPISLPFLFVGGTMSAAILGRGEILRYNMLRAILPSTFLAVFVALVMAQVSQVRAGLFAWLASQALSAVVGVYFGFQGQGIPIRALVRPPNRQGVRALLAFGLKSYFGDILKFMQYRLDVLIVGALLDVEQLGYYVIALSLAELLFRVPNAVGSVLLPRIAVSESSKESARMTPVVSRWIVATSSLSAVALALGASRIIAGAFGETFQPAYQPLLILIPGVVALSLWKVLAPDLIAQGRPLWFSMSALGSVVVMVAGDFLLVPRLGITGAAISSSVAYAVATTVLVVGYRRLMGISLPELTVLRRRDMSQLYNSVRNQVTSRKPAFPAVED